MKKHIPQNIKTALKMAMRNVIDIYSGNSFAKPTKYFEKFGFSISLTQNILHSATVENKIENIKTASKQINTAIIKPAQIFSVWKIIGKPAEANGYKKGRNIINGELHEDFGGGLCQLSGIIYHLALMANLQIVERHNHTIDIYTNETRYTPLGADATIVYGYKDLRIRNNYNFPIRFFIEINNDKLTATLFSEKQINEEQVFFNVMENDELLEVRTLNKNKKLLQISKYKKFVT